MTLQPEPRRVFVKTYGCQMNVHDSARMQDVMEGEGWQTTDTPQNADMIILNTCHIRERAAEKVYSEIGRLAPLKETRNPVIALAGCVAQGEGAEVLRRAHAVDLVIGPQAYHRLPGLMREVDEARRLGKRIRRVALDLPAEEKFAALPPPRAHEPVSAFVTIQEGCDKFCTFCVVPYTRGAQVSRGVAEIEADIRTLITQGVREAVLLGQNVNAWDGLAPDGTRRWTLAQLFAHLAQISGLERLRYTTSHPRDMRADLMEAHAALPKLMPYLHLPVQSGSAQILKAMNRRHTPEEYRRIARELRAARPDIALSSDFIVGFPGESDADFDATLAFAREMRFARGFAFKYSPRPGTPAAEMTQIPEDVKVRRLAVLLEELNKDTLAFNRRFENKIVPVLFERKDKKYGRLCGRTPHNQSVYADAPDALVGHIAPVRITSASINALRGRVEAQEAA